MPSRLLYVPSGRVIVPTSTSPAAASPQIRGSLRPDGYVEITEGHQRVEAMGHVPVPVEVSHPNQRTLENYASAWRVEATQQRVGHSVLDAAQREKLPEIHRSGEALERTKERGVFRGERG